MSAYYQLINTTMDAHGAKTSHYRSLIHSQGAWNTHEQHMGPASGVMAAELEQFQPRSDMRIARLSYDIFGLIAYGDFSITTRIIRPGKTIELLEAEMIANDKTCIVARAWRMLTQDSSAVAGLEDQPNTHPDSLDDWDGLKHWPGGYIHSLNAKTDATRRAGKGFVWVSNNKSMVEGQPTSDFVRLMGMVDTANGVVPRQSSEFIWAFPNIDLQIHMYRAPTGAWLGLETVQQYGADGIGLTSSVLHDIHGPFGRAEQILTLRKMT